MAEQSKSKKALDQLVARAKKDPKFFHSLVFDAEKTIAELDFLDRRSKASLVSLDPHDVIAGLAGLLVNAGGEVQYCGSTCDSSCTNTCGAGSCDATCGSSSCTSTCGSISCGSTVELVSDRFRALVDPAETQVARGGFFVPRRRF